MPSQSENGIDKEVMKEGVGDCPEKYREVYLYFIVRDENGLFIAGSDSQPFKIIIGRRDTFAVVEQAITQMKFGERVLLKLNKEAVQNDKKLLNLLKGEAAPVEIELEIVRLGNYNNALWELESEDREKAASQAKTEGNDLIKKKEYSQAVTKYESGLKAMTNDSNNVFDELKQSFLNNLSLAYLKNNQYQESIKSATQALESQPNNIKLLFRRAQAYSLANEYDKAKIDLNAGLKIEPTNSEIAKELESLMKKEKAQLEKEKKVYTSMFK